MILVLGILTACGTAGVVALTGVGSDLLGTQQGGGAMSVLGLIMALVAFIGTLVTVGLYCLILIAMSEGIYVFLDIEENTREMVRRLGQMGGSAGLPPPT